MIVKFLDLKNDFPFRQVFGKAKNKDMLIHFLNDVLAHTHIGQMVAVQFLKRIRDPEIAAKNQHIIDVRCKAQEGRAYIVEMQIAKQPGYTIWSTYWEAIFSVKKRKKASSLVRSAGRKHPITNSLYPCP